jgi:soluble lytic murein transglycosylase-like protein
MARKDTELWVLIGLLIALAYFGGAGVEDVTGVTGSSGDQTTSLKDRIRIWAGQCGQEPALVLAFCQTESGFNPSAQNPKSSAVGLMQIIPNWWNGVWGNINVIGNLQPSDLLDPEQNIKAGCAILSYFEGKGFVFPDDADVYNLGETAYNAGKRNPGYQRLIQTAYTAFGGSEAV